MYGSNGSGTSTVQNVIVNGCFAYGVRATSTVTSKVETSKINLMRSSCVGGPSSSYGVYNVDTVDAVSVHNAYAGIRSSGQIVKNSATYDNFNSGIQIGGSSDTHITNVYAFNNGYSVYRTSGTGVAAVVDSTFFNPTICQAIDGPSATCSLSVLDFSGATSFLNDDRY
jgi:hypothetical protein